MFTLNETNAEYYSTNIFTKQNQYYKIELPFTPKRTLTIIQFLIYEPVHYFYCFVFTNLLIGYSGNLSNMNVIYFYQK